VKKLPISVTMISGAEASRIGRALESVAGWTSEIIVVLNAEVTDGTEEICARHGAKVFREPWKGFVAQKNSALAKAEQDWVLGLDADEVVSDGLRQEIMAVWEKELPAGTWAPAALIGSPSSPVPEKEQAVTGIWAAFSFPRMSFYLGRWIRHGEWYPDRCIRLWRRGRAEWGGVDPHAALRVNGEVRKLHGDLLHFNMETLNHQIDKTIKYADDFARHCAEQSKRVTVLDLAVRPVWRFVRGYFLRLGFLDGWPGFSIAWLTAFYTFLRYARVLESRQTERPKQ
jgi:glycosyltransferase involved in cell wall biosynthesis